MRSSGSGRSSSTSSNSRRSSSSTRSSLRSCCGRNSSYCSCNDSTAANPNKTAQSMKSASRSVPYNWETQLISALRFLSGGLTYDNRAHAKAIIKDLLS
jgi:hypothetical protein